VREATVNRAPDYEARQSRNVAWHLLPRRESSDCNMGILVQRFEPGGDFEEHSHDLEQFFYVTKGRMEMTMGDRTSLYSEGDFARVKRREPHSGRNVSDGVSELVAIDYWPADSEDRLGLD
jgi:quercetin dioxygenase-like cupin family protein